LRVRNQITEIRTHDLRFTAAETAVFLQQNLGTQVDEQGVNTLTDQTEGWVASLRLMSLSLGNRGVVQLPKQPQPGLVAYVSDYLLVEVLEQLSPAVQEFLLKSSILDRFCGPLCEAVTGLDDPECNGQAYLEWLHQCNLFTIPLDDRREWYRFHHLFQQLLRSRLAQQHTPGEIAALHKRASDWLAKNGWREEAIRYALASGDAVTAATLVAEARHALIDREQWARLERLLHLFSRETIDGNPQLKIIEAWLHNVHGRWEEELKALAITETLLAQTEAVPDVTDPIRGEISLMRANLLGWSYKGAEVLSLVEQALVCLPQYWHYAYSAAYMIKGYGYALTGQPKLAEEHLYRGLTDSRLTQEPRNKSLLLLGLTSLYWLNLNIPNMQLIAEQYLAHGQEFNLPESMAVAHYFLGSIYYQQNDLSEAKKHFAAVANTPQPISINFKVQGICGLLLTLLALGETKQANEVLSQSQAFLLDRQNARLLPWLRACRAEVALAEGRLSEAFQWASSYNPEPFIGLQLFYIPQLTWVKVLLAAGDSTSHEKTATVLNRLVKTARDAHFSSAVLASLPQQALHHNALGHQQLALDHLQQAVHLAEPGGFLRLFVDLGPTIAELLSQLRGQGMAPGYIARILAAFPGETNGTPRPSEPPVSSAVTSALRSDTTFSPSPPLVEPLTRRELDVLALLARQLSDKEIAAELVLSPSTVRRHNHNIYQKLNAKNRWQAVKTATELGILPAS
jgi:LuxR family maltose regulon positive regulatory protein